MFEREKSVSTYMGNYLAIPHGTNEAKDAIKRVGAVGRSATTRRSTGTATRSGSPSGIAGYEGGHLEILGKIAIIFSDTDEVDKLIAAGSAAGALRPAQRGQRRMTAAGRITDIR